MKFIIDNQLPPALVGWLVERGHEATHVYAAGLAEADDRKIWDVAVERKAIVITKDIDFAERREREAAGPQVIWLRVGNVATAELFRLLAARWAAIEASLELDSVVEVR